MKCKKHPKYKAVRKPRAACEDCWRKWFKEEDSRAYVKYAAEQLSRWERSLTNG